ncbi:MAG: oligosaccharide flippase family protein, partial [Candidatus Thorarchaeota archaeon]|nr:oligosaccharide flippase family protein [Candidatus Thorarchaeota archaeon]
MTEDEIENIVARDSISSNVITQSVARALNIIAGLFSSALLVRSLTEVGVWSAVQYADYKVLLSWNHIIFVLVLVGLGTPIVKTISEYANDRRAIGTVLTISIITITLAYLAVAVSTGPFGEAIGFLNDADPDVENTRRLLWPIVLLSMYPTALIQVIKSGFQGIQRMKKVLYAEVAYNLARVSLILFLFFNSLINTFTVLILLLVSTLIACFIAIGLLAKEMRKENIRFNLYKWREISGPLFSLAAVFITLSFVASFFNYATTLFVDFYGTGLDVTRYNLAQALVQTIRTLLYAPFTVLLPNIAGLYARRGAEGIKPIFHESNRVIIPSILFTFIIVMIFGESMLGGIFGTEGTDTTGGVSAFQFLAAMSAGLFIMPLMGVYSNLLSALGRIRPLMILGVASIIIQTIWIVALQPTYGVIVIAFSWVVYVPSFVLYHIYCKRELDLYVPRRYLIKTGITALIFIPISIATLLLANIMLDLLSFISILQITTISSVVRL